VAQRRRGLMRQMGSCFLTPNFVHVWQKGAKQTDFLKLFYMLLSAHKWDVQRHLRDFFVLSLRNSLSFMLQSKYFKSQWQQTIRVARVARYEHHTFCTYISLRSPLPTKTLKCLAKYSSAKKMRYVSIWLLCSILDPPKDGNVTMIKLWHETSP
jgi:hypothetical protein